MQDLIKMVVEKTGLSEEKAQEAIHTVLGFLKDKLPAGIGSHLDSFMGSSNSENKEKSDSKIGNILGEIGDMFGGKK